MLGGRNPAKGLADMILFGLRNSACLLVRITPILQIRASWGLVFTAFQNEHQLQMHAEAKLMQMSSWKV